MIARWLIHYVWQPFARLSRRMPPWPLKAKLQEVAPGVTCVRIDNAVTRALSKIAGGYDYAVFYILRGDVMIDTGFPWAARELQRVLIAQGWDQTIRVVVNTHYHEDHVGNNDVVSSVTKARLFGSMTTVVEARLPHHLPWYRRFLFGPLSAAQMEVAPAQMSVNDLELQLIETPGHCPGHLCVFVPSTGWLFGGDLFVAPDLDTQLPDVNGPAWILSLERILALPVTAFFDAHGAILLGAEAVQEALAHKLHFLYTIEKRVRDHLDHASSIEDLSNQVFGLHNWQDRIALGDGWLSVWTGSDFSRHHLIASFARHILMTRYGEK